MFAGAPPPVIAEAEPEPDRQELVELLLEDHAVEKTAEQDLLVLGGVGVVGGTVSGGPRRRAF